MGLSSIHLQLFDFPACDPILNLMQRIYPSLAVVSVLVVPLQTGTVEQLSMTFEPSFCECADVLDELVFSDPLLRIRRHRLPHRRHNLRSQFRIHNDIIWCV